MELERHLAAVAEDDVELTCKHDCPGMVHEYRLQSDAQVIRNYPQTNPKYYTTKDNKDLMKTKSTMVYTPYVPLEKPRNTILVSRPSSEVETLE